MLENIEFSFTFSNSLSTLTIPKNVAFLDPPQQSTPVIRALELYVYYTCICMVYFQCWTHANLGWKIHVYDELPSTDIQPDTCEPAANRK